MAELVAVTTTSSSRHRRTKPRGGPNRLDRSMTRAGRTIRYRLLALLLTGAPIALTACGGQELDEPARQACTLFVEIVQPARGEEFPSPEEKRAASEAIARIAALAEESEVQALKDAAPLLDEETRTKSLFVDSRDYGSIVLQDLCPSGGEGPDGGKVPLPR